MPTFSFLYATKNWKIVECFQCFFFLIEIFYNFFNVSIIKKIGKQKFATTHLVSLRDKNIQQPLLLLEPFFYFSMSHLFPKLFHVLNNFSGKMILLSSSVSRRF